MKAQIGMDGMKWEKGGSGERRKGFQIWEVLAMNFKLCMMRLRDENPFKFEIFVVWLVIIQEMVTRVESLWIQSLHWATQTWSGTHTINDYIV